MPKHTKIHLTRDELHKMLEEREPGVLYWIDSRPGRRMYQAAGCRCKKGYVQLKLDGQIYRRHRLIYFMHTGEEPTMIDHINGRPGDDRIENLRPADHSTNGWNKRVQSTNTSGYVGVSYRKTMDRYDARIKRNGKSYFLGYYDTAEEAAEAYQHAKTVIHEGFRNIGQPDMLKKRFKRTRNSKHKRYDKLPKWILAFAETTEVSI